MTYDRSIRMIHIADEDDLLVVSFRDHLIWVVNHLSLAISYAS